jgi:uncharacterized repeat protein (TIGR03847 family)
MPRQVFVFDAPERFVAGTVGQPGERTFFLQARQGRRLTSVALEKAQVSVLAERVEELLDEVLRRAGGSTSVPAVAPADTTDDAPLDQPVLEEFRVGAMALAWDADEERVVIEAQAADPDADDEEETAALLDDEAEEGPDLLRVHLTGTMARAFARRAESVVSAGRPSCPFCGLPVDPEGHLCPRANGHRAAATE